MNINIRRGIALIFITAFLIAAPLLTLYTAGYRYNSKKGQVTKTGALIIETEPKGAIVKINGKQTKSETPVRLNNVLPEEYTVTVEKEGYFSWEKRLSVKTQESTFAEDIILFPNTEAQAITEKNENSLLNTFYSPSDNSALFTSSTDDKTSLSLLDLNSQKTTLLFENIKKTENTFVLWSKNDNQVLYSTDAQTLIFKENFPKAMYDISALVTSKKISNFKWEENTLYAQSGNLVYKIDPANKKTETTYTLPSSETLLDYLVYNNEIFLIEKIGTNIILTKENLDPSANKIVESIELKTPNHYFGSVVNSMLTFFDEDTLFLIDLDLEDIAFHKNNVTGTDYHKKENLLLIQTDQEISFLSFENGLIEKNITRYSDGIEKAQWHNSSNYIFALQHNKLKIIELDERNGHVVITYDLENIKSFNQDDKSENLIFEKDNQLWTLPLEK